MAIGVTKFAQYDGDEVLLAMSPAAIIISYSDPVSRQSYVSVGLLNIGNLCLTLTPLGNLIFFKHYCEMLNWFCSIYLWKELMKEMK